MNKQPAAIERNRISHARIVIIGWMVRLDEGAFIGLHALMSIKERRGSRRLCRLTIEDPNVTLMGFEPVFAGQHGAAGDATIGYIASGNFGYQVGKYIAFSYLPLTYLGKG